MAITFVRDYHAEYRKGIASSVEIDMIASAIQGSDHNEEGTGLAKDALRAQARSS